MARVTVEDCVTRVPNRFELVMMAAQRGRNIGAGAPLTLDRDNDKNAVVALREIAEAKVDLKELENGLIRGLQTVVEADEPEGEEMDLLPITEELSEELGEARADQVMSEDELHFEDDAVAAQDAGDDDIDSGVIDSDEIESVADSDIVDSADGDIVDSDLAADDEPRPDLDDSGEPGPF
jgi:DNA-directed RNA polymerase subunit omega